MSFVLDAETPVSTAPDTFRVLESPAPEPFDAGRAGRELVSHRDCEAPPVAPALAVGTPAEAASHAAGVRPLTELPLRVAGRVVALVPPSEPHDPEILARLGELGFLPGEPVRVIAKSFLGDPLAVRVGTGTFALRRAEARCIHVRPEA